MIGCHRAVIDSYLYKVCAEGSNALANEMEGYAIMISTAIDLARIAAWSFTSCNLLTKRRLGIGALSLQGTTAPNTRKGYPYRKHSQYFHTGPSSPMIRS